MALTPGFITGSSCRRRAGVLWWSRIQRISRLRLVRSRQLFPSGRRNGQRPGTLTVTMLEIRKWQISRMMVAPMQVLTDLQPNARAKLRRGRTTIRSYHPRPPLRPQPGKPAAPSLRHFPTIPITRNYSSFFMRLKSVSRYWHPHHWLIIVQDGDLLEDSPPAWVTWKSKDNYLSAAFYGGRV